jgi:hypothetical protein
VRSPTLAAVLLGALLLGAKHGSAQVGHVHPSVEWRTTYSDAVVRASVVKADLSPAEPPFPSSQSSWQWATLTLEVGEVLKGSPPRPVTIALRVPGDDLLPPPLRPGAPALLWFLERRRWAAAPGEEGRPRLEWRLHDDSINGVGIVRLAGAEGKVPEPLLARNLTVLDTEPAIAAAVRAQAKRDRGGPVGRYFYMPVTRDLMMRTGRSGDANAVIVPADERLEAQARRWLRSESLARRLDAVRALENFPSRANAGLLKRALGDRSFQDQSEFAPGGSEWVRVWPVRREALKVLLQWGTGVRPPVTRVLLGEPAGGRP